MKKVFTPDGEYLGRALEIKTTGNDVEITMPGDFPGMVERTVVYLGGSIVYEDENRVYIKYQPKRSTLERQPRTGRRGSDDGRPGRENMKNWTIEQLYDLWRGRGYTKKEAHAKAEKDYKEMYRKKSDIEQHQTMQEMLYN